VSRDASHESKSFSVVSTGFPPGIWILILYNVKAVAYSKYDIIAGKGSGATQLDVIAQT
jgi:hypothetical protein